MAVRTEHNRVHPCFPLGLAGKVGEDAATLPPYANEDPVGEPFGTSRDEFEPTNTTRTVLVRARAAGASMIGDAPDMLNVLENSNDVSRGARREGRP